MNRLRQWLLAGALVLLASACAAILDPDSERTGVIEHAELGEGGHLLLRDVRGDRYSSLTLGLSDGVEIFTEGPGGVFVAGGEGAFQPGVRIRFERTDDLMLLISPPGFWATKIWILRD